MIRQAFMTLSVLVAVGLGLSPAAAQTPPNSVVLQPSPGIRGVIAAGTMPEVVIRGLTSSDDSFWLPNVGLIFSESQANRIVRLDEHDQPVTFIGGLLNPLGMVFTAQGELVSIQTKPGFMGPRVVWPKGHERIIADNYQGKPFGRPNDIVADSKGGLYFTDPNAHRIYYVPPGGTITLVSDMDLTSPNGLQLSHDEKTLYVNDTQGINMHAFDVQPDGRLTNHRLFADYSGRDVTRKPTETPISRADGMVTDNDGRIYALTDSGIEVFAPTGGQHLGAIPVWCFTRRCQNLGFGGPDKRTLYVSGGGTLLRIPMLAQGYLGRAK